MDQFDFYIPEQKIFGQTILPYTQESILTHKKVILSYFPYDQGTLRNGGRGGGSAASKVFSEYLQKIQLYSHKQIEVFCAGIIQEHLDLETAHQHLQQKHKQILKDGKQSQTLLVSIGGSNDQSYPNVSALFSSYPNTKIAVVNLDSHFDVRPLKQGKAHSGSPFRLMLEDQRFKSTNSLFVEFGCKGAACSNVHYQYLNSKGVKVIWMEKNIRRHKLQEDNIYKTQAGQLFCKLMNNLQKEVDIIFISFDVDVINSKWMPGVSAPSVIGGITCEEALEIIQRTGISKKVKLVDFSQFNPAVESIISSHMLVELFYHLCQAVSER